MRRRRAPQPAAGCPVKSRRKLTELDPPAAGCPVKSRRKLAELDDPPPVDRISALPDDLLDEIILLLPVKDGARTQALASRWRRLWRSAPLNLHCCDLATKGSYCKYDASKPVSRVLSAHPGPIRRLCTRRHCLYGNSDEAWLRSAALDNLEELELVGVVQTQPLPASIFRFAATLRVASLADCDLPDDIVQGLHFPRLKQLGLERVRVSECSLHGLIAGCPVLDFLLVHSSSGFRCLRINSLSLTRLCVHIGEPKASTELHFDEIIIENAPRLERLIYLYSIWGLDVSVYYAPKVETMEFLTELQNFARKLVSASNRILIKVLPVDGPTMAVRTVKSLSVNMGLLSLDKVVDLMRLFPCVEKVHVKSDLSYAKNWWPKNWWRRKHRNFIRCHDIRVKTLVLESYLNALSHVNFATIFILNARELEVMTFQTQASVYNDGFLAEQHRKLQLDNRASRGARFHFRTTSCQRGLRSSKHLRDFDLEDPFLGGC